MAIMNTNKGPYEPMNSTLDNKVTVTSVNQAAVVRLKQEKIAEKHHVTIFHASSEFDKLSQFAQLYKGNVQLKKKQWKWVRNF